MDLFEAMRSRRSVRAYIDKPVPRQVIEEVIAFAGMAPSAINLQPWEYIVTYGEEKYRLVGSLLKARKERQVSCGPGTSKPLPRNFAERRRSSIQVMRPHIEQAHKEFNEFIEEGSCSFYGAPVAVIVAMDRIFPKVRYLDVGLSVSYLLLAAHAKGLSTCPIGFITAYAERVAEVLDISEDKEILLGIALGYADPESPVNAFKIPRDDPATILKWYE